MIGRSLGSLFLTLLGLLTLFLVATFTLIFAENTPLPDQFNPRKPLVVSEPVTPLTAWKLKRSLADGALCHVALQTYGDAMQIEDVVESSQCGIKDNVILAALDESRIAPIKTRCQTALRWAMWHEHGLKPAAQEIYGQSISRITHFSSYNCRQMRTTNGRSSRMSTHATAEAIDVSGFVLNDGRQVTLLDGWAGNPDDQAFLRLARDTACTWFAVTLSPDYNALHANHFHLQHIGWGLCR